MALQLRLGSKKKLVAIDWDARDVRMVLFRAKADGIDLLKAVSVRIPPTVSVGDAESMGAFLREALRQARIGVKQALMTIPRDRVVLNTLQLPPTPPDEMASMVQFQVSKELPFAANQATIDFAAGDAFDPKLPGTVLVAAARNEEIDFYRKVATEAGLSVLLLGLRPHGNLVAVTTGWAEASTGTMLMVEVGPTLTEINVVRDGTLAFSRAASVSLGELAEKREEQVQDSRILSAAIHDRAPDEASRQAIAAVMMEIARSYEAYRATEPTLRLDRVVVAGASGIEAELAQALSGRFAVRAEMYTPERALGLAEARARELRGFSAALGLAMSHGRKELSHFDLLHPKKAVSRRSKQIQKAPIAAMVAAVFIAAGVVVRWQYVSPKVAQADRLKAIANSKKDVAEGIKKFGDKAAAIGEWRDSSQPWPAVLARITEAFPSDQEAYAAKIVFETRSPRRRGGESTSTIQVDVKAVESTIVNGLIADLRNKQFDRVTGGKTIPNVRDRYSYLNNVGAEVRRPTFSPDDLVPLESPAEDEEATSESAEGPAATDEKAPVEMATTREVEKASSGGEGRP